MDKSVPLFAITPEDGWTKISEHGRPQPTPQEYDCGCVAIEVITDKDFLLGEQPFEMWLVRPCESRNCEVQYATC